MKKRYLIIAIPIFIYLYFKFSNRVIPIEFRYENIENDSIVFSSDKNLEEYGESIRVVRYDFICPLSNNDLCYQDEYEKNEYIYIETGLNYDYDTFKLNAKKNNNRYFYKTQISISKGNNSNGQKEKLTKNEVISLVKKKGDSLECKIGVLFYFFPPPKYSKSFYIPSDDLIYYLKSKEQ